MSQERADFVDLFAMIEAIAKMEEKAKAEQWPKMLPLITPESAARKDADDNVPLNLALENKAPLAVLSRLLAAWPDAAQVEVDYGNFSLHYAAEYNAPLAFITELLAVYPQGAQEQDCRCRVPLHLAADKNASFEVISALVAAYPEGATIIDQDKNQAVDLDFPLHHACRFAAPIEHILGLLQAQPELAAAKDNKGQVPLHFAAANKDTSLQVVEALLAAYPQGIQEKGKYGLVPLHVALENEAPHDVLSRLLAAWPDAAQVELFGTIPLLYVFGTNVPLAFVTELLVAYPQGAQEKDKYGKVPLHLAADNKASFEVISALITAYPEGATVKDNNGKQAVDLDFPLHHACRFAAPIEHILGLLQAQPELSAAKDKLGVVPLRLAAANKDTSLQVIEALLAAYPQGAQEKDEDGLVPLHVALENEAPHDVLSRLLAVWPDAAQIKDGRRSIPLHYTAFYNSPLAFVMELLVAYPQGAQEKDEDGRMPLHVALVRKAHFEVLSSLLAAEPYAAQVTDRSEYLPLHYAAAYKAPLAFVTELIATYPQGAQKKDNWTKVPLHVALDRKAPLEVLFALLLVDLPFIVNDDGSLTPREHAGSLTLIIDHPKITVEQVSFLVKTLFDKLPLLAQFKLAHTKDAKGRDAISICHADVRDIMHKMLFFCGRYELKDGPPVHKSATAVVMEAIDHGVNAYYNESFIEQAPEDAAEGGTPRASSLTFDSFCVAILFLSQNELFAGNLPSGEPEDARLARFRSLFESFGNKEHDDLVTRSEFIACCRATFGESVRVVIKFMRHKSQHEREKGMRTIDDRHELSSKFVVSLLQGPEPEVFAEAVQKVKTYDGRSLENYQYGLVMPCADRSLDAIFRSERPDMQHVRTMMHELAHAVQHVHDNGVVHGDLKMLNVLRVNNRIKLIDLDAAALYDAQDIEASQYAGAKFSSGVLPPEMFVKLNDNEAKAYGRYWASERESKSELWQKIKPERGRVKKNANYVVKTFRTNEETGIPVLEGLPYAKSLVKASPALDVWSFGLILYKLCAGGDLCPVNRDDDLTGAQMYERCATWRRGEINKEVNDHVHNDDTILAADLICKVLHPDSKQRYTSMKQVLQHPFLIISYASAQAELVAKVSEIRGDVMGEVHEVGARNTELLASEIAGMASTLSTQVAANFCEQAVQLQKIKEETVATRELALKIDERTQRIDERTINIEKLSIKTIARIEKTEQVLLRGMIEASDVQVPSCFIIVNQKLDLPTEYLKAQAVKEEQETAKLDEYQQAKAAKAGRLMGFFNAVTENVSKGLAAVKDKLPIESISALAADPLSICDGDDFWLYLIDEHTMQPIIPLPDTNSCYPIRIKAPNEFVPKYMPYMKLALAAMSVYNGAAGLVQSLGYPVPAIPASLTASAKAAVGKLDHKSSVDAFDVLQGSLDTLNVDSKILAELKADFQLIFPWQCECSWSNDKEENAFTCEQCSKKNKSYNEEAAKAVKRRLKEEQGSTEKKTVRGKGLFDFQQFLLEHDAQNTFCDLRRVISPSGKTIWCANASVEAMEKEAMLEQEWGEGEGRGEGEEELKQQLVDKDQQLAEHKRHVQELLRRLSLYAPLDAKDTHDSREEQGMRNA